MGDDLRWPCAECGRLGFHNEDSDCCEGCSRRICETRGIKFHGRTYFPDSVAATKARKELAELDQKRWPITAMRLREIVAKGSPQ